MNIYTNIDFNAYKNMNTTSPGLWLNGVLNHQPLVLLSIRAAAVASWMDLDSPRREPTRPCSPTAGLLSSRLPGSPLPGPRAPGLDAD